MLPPNQLTDPGNTGQPDGLQCRGSGNQMTHTNHITTTITSTSQHTRADIPNQFNEKILKNHSTIIPAAVQQLWEHHHHTTNHEHHYQRNSYPATTHTPLHSKRCDPTDHQPHNHHHSSRTIQLQPSNRHRHATREPSSTTAPV